MGSDSPASHAKRLPEEVARKRLEELGGRLEARAPKAWKWRGRSIKLFDATTVSMPDTPSNQRAYAQSSEPKPGLGFPIAWIARVNRAWLRCGAVLGYEVAACKGKGTGEQALLRTLYRHIQPGDIVLEVDFRTLKATMAMDVLSCKSQAMIDKEIAVHRLAYNLVRWAMAKAALLSQILPSVLNELWAFLKSICVTTAANVQDG